jgi:sterol 14-demethylase
MKIVVDEQLCKGHGVCMGEAPEVFQVTRKGEQTILQPHPGEALRAQVEAAVKYCPTGALSIEAGE